METITETVWGTASTINWAIVTGTITLRKEVSYVYYDLNFFNLAGLVSCLVSYRITKP